MNNKYKFLVRWLTASFIVEFLDLTVWQNVNFVTLLELDFVTCLTLIIIIDYIMALWLA